MNRYSMFRGSVRPLFTLASTAALAACVASQPGDSTGDTAESPLAEDAYLIGRGIADVTGEAAEGHAANYGRLDQATDGIHIRQRSRAFIVVDRGNGKRVALVTADVGSMYNGVRQAVLRKLEAHHGTLYNDGNLLLSATHTHAAPGGYADYTLYNIVTLGFHRKTFDALVDGVVESIERAHAELGPGAIRLARGQVANASVNRSRGAFDRDPAEERALFPNGIDPASTLLRFDRGGSPVGALNWFATHGTSMTGENHLISGDNKGYAAYHWERVVTGVDYRAANPGFVAAFAQTNPGDMSPNLFLEPGKGPTDDEFENTRIIGTRQYEAARQLLDNPTESIGGAVDYRSSYVDMSSVTVRPEFTGDGQSHTTCQATLGASFAAGSKEDGPGPDLFNEGAGNNPLVKLVADARYIASPELRACQAPKEILLDTGALGITAKILPLQLLRLGQLYVISLPLEPTIVAGLHLRRTVASRLGVPIQNVIVAGYANEYAGYVTTPKEYDQQDYEGGHTMYGRWLLPAVQQEISRLADDLKAGRPSQSAPTPPDGTGSQPVLQPGVVWDAPAIGTSFGDVVGPPLERYTPGQQVKVEFVGAHPSNHLHRGGTYLEVQRAVAGSWQTVADDGDWATKFRWARWGVAASRITITWDLPANVQAGTYRIVYRGDAKDLGGQISAISGTSPSFVVQR